jgi:hypothetical protein
LVRLHQTAGPLDLESSVNDIIEARRKKLQDAICKATAGTALPG